MTSLDELLGVLGGLLKTRPAGANPSAEATSPMPFANYGPGTTITPAFNHLYPQAAIDKYGAPNTPAAPATPTPKPQTPKDGPGAPRITASSQRSWQRNFDTVKALNLGWTDQQIADYIADVTTNERHLFNNNNVGGFRPLRGL